MAEEKDIDQQKKYTDEDYRNFKKKLFSSTTPLEELEKICMTLTHQPTKEAQEILARFKQSDRAAEVHWLDMAMDEGQFHYLEPLDEQEERDYLALKVMQEIEDQLMDLEAVYEKARVEALKMTIEHDAIRELGRRGEAPLDSESGLKDAETAAAAKLEKLQQKILLKEKTYDQIKAFIKCEKYKDVDPGVLRDVHFG